MLSRLSVKNFKALKSVELDLLEVTRGSGDTQASQQTGGRF